MDISLFQAIVPAPFGAFGVQTEGDRIVEIVYLPPRSAERAPTDALAERVAEQLLRYLGDAEFRFDLPLHPAGTDFQRRVWTEIARIPRGRVDSYGRLAQRLRSAARAVGQACGANPYPPIIPCHRVVAAADIGGFANHRDGYLIAAKRWLLAHEQCPL
jgi:methylated-DNA-[protein]-cysteine S-methyltransferase